MSIPWKVMTGCALAVIVGQSCAKRSLFNKRNERVGTGFLIVMALYYLYMNPQQPGILARTIYKWMFIKPPVVPPEVLQEREEMKQNLTTGNWTRKGVSGQLKNKGEAYSPKSRITDAGREYVEINGMIEERDLVSGKVLTKFTSGSGFAVGDGYLYVAAGGNVGVWDLMTRGQVAVLSGIWDRSIEHLVVDNGRLFVSTEPTTFLTDRIIRIWDVETFKCIGSIREDKVSTFLCVKKVGKLRTEHYKYNFLPGRSQSVGTVNSGFAWQELLEDIWVAVYHFLSDRDREQLCLVNKILWQKFSRKNFSHCVGMPRHQAIVETLRTKTWNITSVQLPLRISRFDNKCGYYRGLNLHIDRWDVETGNSLPPLVGHTQPYIDAIGEQEWLYSIARNGELIVWSAETGTLISSLQTGLTVEYGCFLGVQESCVFIKKGNQVHVWDVVGGTCKFSIDLRLLWQKRWDTCLGPTHALFLAHSDYRFACTYKNAIWLVRETDGDSFLLPEWHKQPITTLATHENMLFSGSQDGEVLVWDLDRLHRRPITLHHGLSPIAQLSVANGKLYATTEDNWMHIWDLVTRKRMGRFQGAGHFFSMVQDKIFFRPLPPAEFFCIYDLAPPEVTLKNRLLSYVR